MPVKIWDQDDRGLYTSRIQTSLSAGLGGEEYRADAEELDAQIDTVLERATYLLSETTNKQHKRREFVKRWAIGRAITDSGILQSPHIASEPKVHLWLAMARKCRLGIRYTGEVDQLWRTLIPNRKDEPHRIERDIFAIGLWLQEQELDDALDAFGGRLANAREIHRREPLRSLNLRNALARWCRASDPDKRAHLFRAKEFVAIAKALQRRWPSRGPGSAKRPVHLSDHDLDREVHRILTQVGSNG